MSEVFAPQYNLCVQGKLSSKTLPITSTIYRIGSARTGVEFSIKSKKILPLHCVLWVDNNRVVRIIPYSGASVTIFCGTEKNCTVSGFPGVELHVGQSFMIEDAATFTLKPLENLIHSPIHSPIIPTNNQIPRLPTLKDEEAKQQEAKLTPIVQPTSFKVKIPIIQTNSKPEPKPEKEQVTTTTTTTTKQESNQIIIPPIQIPEKEPEEEIKPISVQMQTITTTEKEKEPEKEKETMFQANPNLIPAEKEPENPTATTKRDRDSTTTIDNETEMEEPSAKRRTITVVINKAKEFCNEVLERLMKHPSYVQYFGSATWDDPISVWGAEYKKKIKKPMYLGLIRQKSESGDYKTIEEFQEDIKLIVKNCQDFNGEAYISRLAIIMQERANTIFNALEKREILNNEEDLLYIDEGKKKPRKRRSSASKEPPPNNYTVPRTRKMSLSKELEIAANQGAIKGEELAKQEQEEEEGSDYESTNKQTKNQRKTKRK